MDLTKFIDAGTLGGWTRSIVGALLTAGIAKVPGLGTIIDPGTQTAIAVAVSGIVVGAWSHTAKNMAAAPAPAK